MHIEEVMDLFLQMIKALADQNRMRIMAALLQHEELCACQLTELLGVAGATASRHLAQLQGAGLVEGRKEGRWVYFKLSGKLPDMLPLAWLKERLFESDVINEDIIRLNAILLEDPEEICRRQRDDSICRE
jgi:ArsR family transcriptional regulator, arsenate/arsenite/antimonite-responsive transcriptional repressor